MSRSSLQLDIDTTEEDVLFRSDSRSVGLFFDGELGPLLVILDCRVQISCKDTTFAICKVAGSYTFTKGWIGRTSFDNVLWLGFQLASDRIANLPSLSGLQSVKVWAETRFKAARHTTADERT